MRAVMSMRSGRQVDLMAPTPEAVSLEDIAHSLSLQCRFCGHTREFYSVAQHTLVVARLVRQAIERGERSNGALTRIQRVQRQRQALHHDDAEAYIGDVIGPLRGLVPAHNRLEKAWGRAISARLELWAYSSSWLNRYDRLAAAVEAHALLNPVPDWAWERINEEPTAFAELGPIEPLPPLEARMQWLAMHETLWHALIAARREEPEQPDGEVSLAAAAGRPPTRFPKAALDPYPPHRSLGERRS